MCFPGSSSSLLDAFFFGKAFAETLNERLGTALDDLLADFGKKDAERREAMRYLLSLASSLPLCCSAALLQLRFPGHGSKQNSLLDLA